MKFAHPNFLFALFLLVIPVIVHLFNFRRHKTLHFSSTKFLKKVTEQTRSVSKIKHWILLVLRILAYSSVILAFARPYTPLNDNEFNNTPVLAIYVDNSTSMQMMTTDGKLISKAIETAKNIVERAETKTTFLITSNDFIGSNQRVVNKTDAIDLIDQISLSRNQKSSQEITDYQISYLKEINRLDQAKLVYISDFQKSTTKLPFAKDSLIQTPMIPILITSQNYGNIFIDSVWFKSPIRKTGFSNELHFRVNNTSSQLANSVSVRLSSSETNRSISVDIPAQSSIIAQISYTDKKAGIHKFTLSAADKNVHFDDEFYFSYIIKESLNIGIINGENSTKNPEKLFSLDSLNKLYITSENQINIENIINQDLIVLNELNVLSSGLQSNLEMFVKKGGTIVIIPSIQMNTSSFNTWLNKENLSIFGSKSGAASVSRINYDFPFFDHIFSKKDPNVTLPKLNHHFPFKQNNSNRIHHLMDFKDGSPFFIQSSNSNKSIYIFSAGASDDFGDFGSHAIFSTLLLRISEESFMKNPLYTYHNSGSIYRIIDPLNKKTAVKAKLPESGSEFIPYQIRKDNHVDLFIDQSEDFKQMPSGNYTLESEGKNIGTLSINLFGLESFLSSYKSEEVNMLFKASGFNTVEEITIENGTNLLKLDNNPQKEFWRILLILGIVFLVMEIIVIKLFKN